MENKIKNSQVLKFTSIYAIYFSKVTAIRIALFRMRLRGEFSALFQPSLISMERNTVCLLYGRAESGSNGFRKFRSRGNAVNVPSDFSARDVASEIYARNVTGIRWPIFDRLPGEVAHIYGNYAKVRAISGARTSWRGSDISRDYTGMKAEDVNSVKSVLFATQDLSQFQLATTIHSDNSLRI